MSDDEQQRQNGTTSISEGVRRSRRKRFHPKRFTYDKKGNAVCNMLALRMASQITSMDSNYDTLMNMMTDSETGYL